MPDRPAPSVPAAVHPIRVALVDDYDIVLIGLAHMFDGYRDRVMVAEIDANRPVADEVDVVLYDSFAQPEADKDEVQSLIDSPHGGRVVIYTWNFHPELIDRALDRGARGYLSKTLPASELVQALEDDPRRRGRRQPAAVEVELAARPRLAGAHRGAHGP